MEELDFWRLCEDLPIIHAALLLTGECYPSSKAIVCEELDPINRPFGYEAAKYAIISALRHQKIKGNIIPIYDSDINGNRAQPFDDSIDIHESTVNVESLRAWLVDRGFRNGFFFPEESEMPDYLDPKNPYYAPKLAAAVHAWQAVTTDARYSGNGQRVKKNLQSWLTAHAADFDLIKPNGDINSEAIDNQISKVANWDEKGGAPSTPNK